KRSTSCLQRGIAFENCLLQRLSIDGSRDHIDRSSREEGARPGVCGHECGQRGALCSHEMNSDELFESRVGRPAADEIDRIADAVCPAGGEGLAMNCARDAEL